VTPSSGTSDRLIAELREQLDKANETILQLQQLLQAKSGNLYEGIKLTRNQRTVVDMLLATNGICSKEHLYAALYPSRQAHKPDLQVFRETLRVIRKQLRPHGIDIQTLFGKGYTMPSESKSKLRGLIII
jgi:DNA-binding winged helix-turn-helix (wHTH) protein